MDDLGFEEAVDGLGQGIVIAVADAANRGFDACFCKAFGVFYRQILGGFNRSSQHPNFGGVDDDGKTKIGMLHSGQIILAKTAACLAA